MVTLKFDFALLSHIAHVARKVLRTRGDDVIEDIRQDVCRKMWESRAEFDPSKGTMEAWATIITRNTARDFAKNHADKNRSLDVPASRQDDGGDGPSVLEMTAGHGPDPERALITKQAFQAAQAAAEAAGMADMFAAVVNGDSDDDMARDRGIAPGGIRKRRHDMRRVLRRSA